MKSDQGSILNTNHSFSTNTQPCFQANVTLSLQYKLYFGSISVLGQEIRRISYGRMSVCLSVSQPVSQSIGDVDTRACTYGGVVRIVKVNRCRKCRDVEFPHQYVRRAIIGRFACQSYMYAHMYVH